MMPGNPPQGPVLQHFNFTACFESLQRAENAHKQSLVVATTAKVEAKDATAIAAKAYDSCKKQAAAIFDATEIATKTEKVAFKNRKNISRLAKSNLSFDLRLKSVERKQVLG